MTGRIGSLPIALVLAACTEDGAPIGRATSAQYFEQAVRRDPDATERARIVSIPETGCAAFVLETTSQRVIIATALHCVSNDLDAWCKRTNAAFASDGSLVTCKTPIAAEPKLDFAVFEADMAHATTGETTLRLAAYEPRVNTRLRTTGFPTDPERNERVTTTENCWDLGVTRDLVIDPDSANAHTLSFALRHNCTSFIGNSGGPAWVENTRDAVGVGSGAVDDTSISPSDDIASAAVAGPSANFVGLHRAALLSAGVVIVEAQIGEAESRDGGAPALEQPNASTNRESGAKPSDAESDEGCAAGGRTTTNGGAAFLALVAMVVFARRRVSPPSSR